MAGDQPARAYEYEYELRVHYVHCTKYHTRRISEYSIFQVSNCFRLLSSSFFGCEKVGKKMSAPLQLIFLCKENYINIGREGQEEKGEGDRSVNLV